MYAKYIKKEIPDLNGTGRTQAYYKMQLTSMSYDQFVSLCSREGHMEESTILAVMSLVSEKLALSMAEGFSVKLTRNAHSIMVTGVAYRADNDLIRTTSRKCTLERGGVSRIRKSNLTLEQRIQKAREFLEKNMFMRVPDYVRLTGLSRTTASMELRRLALDPTSGITSKGSRSQKFYVLRK